MQLRLTISPLLNLLRVPLCALALALVIPPGAPWAATLEWTGTVDTDWQNAANWSPPQVPTVEDTVSIPTGTVSAPANSRFGTLLLSGAAKLQTSNTVTGTLVMTNTASVIGSLVVANGARLVMGGGSVNSWVRVEPGGTLESVGSVYPKYFYGGLTNAGTIRQSGWGLQLATSSSGLNQAGAVWEIQDDSHVHGHTMYEALRNEGLLVKSGGTGTSLCSVIFTNTGRIEARSGTLQFSSAALAFDGDAYLHGELGAALRFAGSLRGTTRNSVAFNAGCEVLIEGGTSEQPRVLEAMSLDDGPQERGFERNFAFKRLTLAPGAFVRLTDDADNTPGNLHEAVYVETLIVPQGSCLDLNGLNLHARAVLIAGQVGPGTIHQIPERRTLQVGESLPASLSLPGELDEWTFFGRQGRSVTVLVNPGATNVPAPVPPLLDWVEVKVLDSAGTVLQTVINTAAGARLELLDVPLSVDGEYRVRVRAHPEQPQATGNYHLAVYDVTPRTAALVLNQTLGGRIEVPYSVDRWRFSGLAGQQVRFELVNRSSDGVAFSFRGPNDWGGFTNATESSGLLTLPYSGEYALSVSGRNGQYGVDYAFRLVETVQTELALGEEFTGQFVGHAQAQLFKINNPQNRPLRLVLEGSGEGNRAELYAGFSLPPTRGSYSHAAAEGTGAQREILVGNAFAGTWYALVYGDTVATPGPFTVRVESADLFLSRLDPGRTGNGGRAVIEMHGAGFQPDAEVSVQGPGLTLAAASFTWVSPERAVVEFNLAGVPAGSYQVAVKQGDATATVPLEVAGAVGPKFEADIIVPNGLGLNTVNTLYVEYKNTGDMPMVAPLLQVTGHGFGIPVFSLEPKSLGGSFWAASRPENLPSDPTFYASGRIPGILLPGESGRQTVYFLGMRRAFPWLEYERQRMEKECFQYVEIPPPGAVIIGWRLIEVPAGSCPGLDLLSGTPSIGFQLLKFLPPSARSGFEGQTIPNRALTWQELRTNVPPTIDAGAWEAIWHNYTNSAGNSLYSYFAMLEQNMDHLHRLGLLGSAINQIDDLAGFELAQADGIHVVRSVASATDAAVPTTGLSLGLARSFPNTISTRYRLGAFGRGWMHSWEARLGRETDDVIVITGPGGARRRFRPDSRSNAYLPDPGDYGRLLSWGGNVFSVREKNGVVQMFNADGTLHYVEDPNGNRITCTHQDGRLASLAHSGGQRLDLSYTPQGRIAAITDTLGRETRFGYDPAGEHLLSATYYDGLTVNYQYCAGDGPAREHALKEIGYPDGSHRFYSYDDRGRLQRSSLDGDAEAMTYAFNDTAVVLATDAAGNTSRFAFDNRGLLVQLENPLGDQVRLQFDEQYNLASVADPAGRSYQYTYDKLGNLQEMQNPLGHRTQFQHEPLLSRLSQLTDSRGNRTRYHHDTAGNLQGITYPNGTSERWEADGAGNPVAWTNRRSDTIRYAYNPTNGFVTAKTYPDGSQATYEYDARGNLIAASNHTGLITMEYYPGNDWLKRVTYPGERWLEYTYDPAGRRQTMTDQLGYTLSYGYDALGRLHSITNSDHTRLVLYEYDPAGRLARKTLGNGVYSTFHYDRAGRLLSLTNAQPNHAVLSFFRYTYDTRGRRTRMATHYGTWDYGYDDLGQLSNAVLSATQPGVSDQDLVYFYDSEGNRVRTVENGVVRDYIANTMNEYTSVGGLPMAYDADGNLVRDESLEEVRQMVFTPDNRLSSFTSPFGTHTYGYDALGQRSRLDEGEGAVSHVFDFSGLSCPIAEFDDSGDLRRRRDYGLGLVAETDEAGALRYFTFDPMGNACEVLGGNGQVIESARYEPFGTPLPAGALHTTAFGFSGAWGVPTDRSGLVHMRARQYFASVGRFVSPDPIGLVGGDVNLLRYCRSNPVSLIDPSGREDVADAAGSVWEEAIKWTGLTLGWASNTANNSKNRRNMTNNLDEAERKDINDDLDPYGDKALERKIGNDTAAVKAANLWSTLKNHPVRDEAAEGWIETKLWIRLRAQEISWTAHRAVKWTQAKIKVWVPIFASRDPNQKVALAGVGAEGYIAAGSLVPYRIDFENDKDATAPAQQVSVRDPLAATLDWTTFELTEIAFGDVFLAVPPKTQHYETNVVLTMGGTDFEVRIEAGIRLATGEVYAELRSIDPATELPPPVSVGFLQPEDGTGRGQGHVSYVIRPRADLPDGTAIRNVALITFDQRETIATDQVEPHDPGKGVDPAKQALVTLDTLAPGSAMIGLPEKTETEEFEVAWQGGDAAGGSGIGSYTIFVSTNGAPFGAWLTQTTNTSALFTGVNGATYGFCCLATDRVGNGETKLVAVEAETTVELPGQVAPWLAAEPVDIQVRLGGTAEFGVAAGGIPEPAYAWLRDGVGLAEDARITGIHQPMLTISGVTLADEGLYSVLVTNAVGAVESRAAALNVVTATLEAYTVRADGAFTMAMDDLLPGRVYRIYLSTDLEHWTLMLEVRNTAGAFVFADGLAAGVPHRFYTVREASAAGGP